ncbi:MAG TPA: LysE family translocator [Methanobacterium sp.]|nr:LysE family translocator [Methanobacterium sp.]
MFNLLIAGITLGLYSGFSPGPLLILLISQTLKHGCREGIKVAFSPLITDLPIIAVSLIFLSFVAGYNSILGIISILGGLFLLYMAYESFKTRGLTGDIEAEDPKSLKKGITVNFLNPSPYLFWITVGGPIIITAYTGSILTPLMFIIGFYALLIGSKIILAFAAGKSREFITGRPYLYIMRILGVVLVIFALYFFNQGVHLLMT